MTRYKVVLIGVRGYKHRETLHNSLDVAKRIILKNISYRSSRPAWILRVKNGKETHLPGQYEVHRDWRTGRVGLFVRLPNPNRLGDKPVMLK